MGLPSWQHPESETVWEKSVHPNTHPLQWTHEDGTGSPAGLWRSGNPWQCDFCFFLCIKSRCQEPSPPQPDKRLDLHLSTHLSFFFFFYCYILFGLQMLLRRSSSTADVEHLWPETKSKKGDFGIIISLVIWSSMMHFRPLLLLPWNERWRYTS